jgi:hypothetical protein
MLGRSTSARRQKSPCPLPVAIFAVRRMDVRFEELICYTRCRTLPRSSIVSLPRMNHGVSSTTLRPRGKAPNGSQRLFKQLRQSSSQAFRKRHSPAAFRSCRNAGNSVLTAEGTTSKGTGSISCDVEFCIFYRLSLRTLQTKDVISMHYLAILLYKLINIVYNNIV